jgi:hypothetical protein
MMHGEEVMVEFLSRNHGDKAATQVQVLAFLDTLIAHHPVHSVVNRATNMRGFLFHEDGEGGAYFCGVLYIYCSNGVESRIEYNPADGSPGSISAAEYIARKGWGYNDG